MERDGRRNYIKVTKLEENHFEARYEQHDPNSGRVFPGKAAHGSTEQGAIENLIGAEKIIPAEPNVLQAAMEMVDGPRQDVYGPPIENHTRTAKLWNAYLSGLGFPGVDIEPEDVCVMNMLQKISRLRHTPGHRDSIVDIAGYARNLEMIEEDREQRLSAVRPLVANMVFPATIKTDTHQPVEQPVAPVDRPTDDEIRKKLAEKKESLNLDDYLEDESFNSCPIDLAHRVAALQGCRIDVHSNETRTVAAAVNKSNSIITTWDGETCDEAVKGLGMILINKFRDGTPRLMEENNSSTDGV